MSAHTHGYQQRIGILLARLCHGKGRQWGELKMFSLLCEQDFDVCIIWKSWMSGEKAASQSWVKTQNRKKDAKNLNLPIWRILSKKKLWNVGYLWVDEIWIVLCLAEQYQCPGARQHTVFPPLSVGQGCCSWGRKTGVKCYGSTAGPFLCIPSI